jgi:hypothetical protein
MRLIQYINEEKIYKIMIPKMEKECSKFIKDIRGSRGNLIRSDFKKSNWEISKNKTRDERNPTDTSRSLTILINKSFKKKFGWNARTENVVFCWGNTKKIINSTARYVFPVGDYKFVYSTKVFDLYGNLHDPGLRKKLKITNKLENRQEELKILYNYFISNYLNTYSNKDIQRAVLYENEIMINCKYYYLVSHEVINEVNQELNLKWDFLI